jgi:hypothetical protein
MLMTAATRRLFLILATLACAVTAQVRDTPVYFSPDPGYAKLSFGHDGSIWLSNDLLRTVVHFESRRIAGITFGGMPSTVEGLHAAELSPISTLPFTLVLGDGTVLPATSLKLLGEAKLETLDSQSDAPRLAERFHGRAAALELEDEQGRLHVTWRLILRNSSNYLRQEITIAARSTDVPVREVRLVDLESRNAHVSGIVKGSPVVSDQFFAGFENPLSTCAVANGRARCWIERELPLKASQSVTYSSVIGIASPGQLRRSFLHYVERERAHPYRPYLNYNSWYDLGYFSRYDEQGALSVINAFGTELTRKRGVPIASFLFDDGWDNPETLWQFNGGFPDGFNKLRDTAASYGTAPGVWLSPWGGYGKPRQQRVAAGSKAGYETEGIGFALSGPKYYQAFHEACVNFVKRYGVNQFKFDGTGNADRVVPGSQFDSDFAAAIQLIGDLRALKPDLYINLTTGTYPSPFWLHYADSIWRGGEDHEFLGVGPKREQWITYRDADVYEHIVMSGPLFPLNSLMLHGMIYARFAKNLDTDPSGSFANEVHDFFGNGTQLQEMYITPSLLSQDNWDTLAEAAQWSRSNADVLVDAHWIGGDPAMLEVYGWASWSPNKAILVLRNPSDKPQSISIDIGQALELPSLVPQGYELHSPWKQGSSQPSLRLAAGVAHSFSLKPFEVLVLEGAPIK